MATSYQPQRPGRDVFANTSPARTARPAAPAAAPADTLLFLSTLYHGLAGWCELSYIDGDPSDRTAPFRREWHHIAGDYRPLAARCAALGAQYGNVYISRTLYAEKRRSVDCAQPTRVIFVDDLPAAPALAPSMVVQTSATSRHGYYLASELLPNTDGADLARRAAAALGADPSGADLTQIVRVPGCTFNTKRGDRWPVQLVASAGPIYPTAQLAGSWPALPAPTAPGLALDDQRVAWWLGNIGLLLDHEGLPRRIHPPKKPGALDVRAIIKGKWSGDTSARRYTVAKSLVMRGYTDDEAAALLLHFCADGGDRKGGRWLLDDVGRCLAKARQEITPYLGVRPTALSAKYQTRMPQALPDHAPRRKGRPVACTAAQLLAFYQQHADTPTHCMMSRADVCAALRISAGVLGRLEKQLADQGAIYRQTAPDRRRSWVVLGARPADFGMIKNTETAANSGPAAAISDHTDSAAESHESAGSVSKEHTPLEAPASVAAGGALPLVEPAGPCAQAQPGGGACSPNSAAGAVSANTSGDQPASLAPAIAPVPAGLVEATPAPSPTPPPPPAPPGAQRLPRTESAVYVPGAPLDRPVTVGQARAILRSTPLGERAPQRYRGQAGPNAAALAILLTIPGYDPDELPTPPAPAAGPAGDPPPDLLDQAAALIAAADFCGYEALKAQHPAFDWASGPDLRHSYRRWRGELARPAVTLFGHAVAI